MLARKELFGVLESERLFFRKIEDRDFSAVAQSLRDPGVQKVWEHIFSDDDVREWIKKRQQGYRDNGIDYLLAVEKASKEVVGQIGLLQTELEGQRVWAVGYLLNSRFCGKGYATEGARTMVDYGFHRRKLPKIVCDITPTNRASIAVAKRLGMVETGSFVKIYRGKRMPHLIFELQNPDEAHSR